RPYIVISPNVRAKKVCRNHLPHQRGVLRVEGRPGSGLQGKSALPLFVEASNHRLPLHARESIDIGIIQPESRVYRNTARVGMPAGERVGFFPALLLRIPAMIKTHSVICGEEGTYIEEPGGRSEGGQDRF